MPRGIKATRWRGQAGHSDHRVRQRGKNFKTATVSDATESASAYMMQQDTRRGQSLVVEGNAGMALDPRAKAKREIQTARPAEPGSLKKGRGLLTRTGAERFLSKRKIAYEHETGMP